MRAAAQWQEMVRVRLEEIERLHTRSPAGAEYWDARAGRFSRRFPRAGDDDPVVARLSQAVRSSDILVDVGAGAGRYALPLAAHVREVVAVEPSAGMLERLEARARTDGVDNVRTVQGRWPDTRKAGNVVLCAFVLPLVTDVEQFVTALDDAADRLGVIVLSGSTPDVHQEPFWRHFHGRRRSQAPTYLDMVQVLADCGIDAHVAIVETPPATRFDDLDDAVAEYRQGLLLPADPETDAELRRLLEPWLVEQADGRLRVPFATTPVAILSWQPG